MRMNNEGQVQLILLLILAIVVGIVIFGGFLFVAFSTKALITVALVGMGLFLFVRPSGLAGNMRAYVPFILIILGIVFYAGVFDKIVGL
jgi:hypothetical protein